MAKKDSVSRKVVKRERKLFEKLEIACTETSQVSNAEKETAYFRELFSGSLSLKNWNADVDHFLMRIDFANFICPEFKINSKFNPINEHVFREICKGKSSWKEIKNAEVLPVIRNSFSTECLKTLDRICPEKINLGNGSEPFSINYSQKKALIRVPLQKLYEIKIHPKVALDKYNLLIEVLAPNGRCVQITQDIPSFWKNSYPTIRKELAGRYPKHEWR